MKKYLLSALALPLLFACSSEDYLDQKATDNDQFAGIEKVDATFSLADMDEGSSMRLAKDWGPELNDRLGFAWLTDGKTPTPVLTLNGNAYQNHPLFLKQDGDKYKFVPETSIYVGKYFVYYPFDETTVDIGKINFKSLEEQTITDGMGGESWAAVAKKSINIGDKFTEVIPGGTTDAAGKTWDEPGIGASYKLYAAPFSNQTGLDLTYQKNNPKFAAAQRIQGATDIDFTIAKDEEVGAANIYGGTVQLTGAAKSFTYAPTTEPSATHSGTYWENKKDLNTNNIGGGSAFTWATGTGSDVITLKAPEDAENGISTDKADNKGWFWFNSLPVTQGNATSTTNVVTTLETSYGVVTITKTLADCAYAYEDPAGTSMGATTYHPEWIKLAAADATTPTRTWDPALHNTFVNQYGDHKGKYALTVDFSTGVMNGMHIKNDEHLQTLLKYYIASGKTETGAVLNLDGASATDKTFKISKLSIALLQTINKTTTKVTVQACASHNNPVKIIVTQDGSEGKTEVPNLDKVFAVATDVYLSKDCEWTWKDRTAPNQLTIDAGVKSITNEGKLTVNATNIELSTNTVPLYNAAGATMDITKVTTVKDALTNLGTINVKEGAELRAYGVEIKNDATGLNVGEYGVINNSGVVGKTEGTSGQFNNYGFIYMKVKDAITLLNSNEIGTKPFGTAFTPVTNMMGTVVLPENNPTAIVSVANADANGFIKYTWPATEPTYKTPAGNVKYNTIVVSGDIEFTATETEIQYIEFNGTKTQVVNPGGLLTNLKGVIVNDDKSIIIEKGNTLKPKVSVFLGEGATVYKGGTFTINGTPITGTITNYFGNWTADQIVAW